MHPQGRSCNPGAHLGAKHSAGGSKVVGTPVLTSPVPWVSGAALCGSGPEKAVGRERQKTGKCAQKRRILAALWIHWREKVRRKFLDPKVKELHGFGVAVVIELQCYKVLRRLGIHWEKNGPFWIV